MRNLRSHLGRRGLLARIARPFVFLLMIVGLIGGTEMSAAMATEFLSAQEAELSRLLNDARVSNGLPQLAHSDALRTVARRHAQKMMVEGRIFHNERLAEDIQAVFPDWARVGENVGVSPSIPSVHRAFMESPGHRANVLDPDWGWLGIGVVSGGSRLFVTENFLKLRPGAPRPIPAQFRLAGSGRTATAATIADFGFSPGTAQGVVIAPAGDFHGALAAGSLAASVGGPLVLSGTDSLAPEATDAINRALGTNSGKTAYLVGGPFAAGVQASLSGLGLNLVSIGGADHVETAAAVAQALPRRPTSAFITTVTNYPDALAGAAVSAATGWPVLYTDPKALSAGTRDVLGALGIRSTYVLGGPAAVSDGVVGQLASAGAPMAERIAGADRYATGTAIATFGLNRGLRADHVMVATGQNFPDALAGGGLANVLKAPVLLTPSGDLAGSTAAWLSQRKDAVDAIYLLGGEAALSTRVQDAIARVFG